MIVFVTGATAGFGLSIARRFAGGGARVIAAGRRAERLEALRDELGAERVCNPRARCRHVQASRRRSEPRRLRGSPPRAGPA